MSDGINISYQSFNINVINVGNETVEIAEFNNFMTYLIYLLMRVRLLLQVVASDELIAEYNLKDPYPTSAVLTWIDNLPEGTLPEDEISWLNKTILAY